jgi:hypothetical protein
MSRNAPFLLIALLLASGCPSVDPPDPFPELVIESPDAAGEYVVGDVIGLRVRVSDHADSPSDLDVRWTLDIGFEQSASPDITGVAIGELPNLGEGTYQLVTEVEDTDGNITDNTMAITITRVNIEPTCAITSPAEGGLVAAEQANEFTGTVADEEDGPEDLVLEIEVGGVIRAAAEIAPDGTWVASVDGLAIGSRRVTAVARDSDSGSCRTDVQVSVSSAPEVSITSPLIGAEVSGGGDLEFTGTATDYQDSEFSLIAVWTSNVDGFLGSLAPTSVGEVRLAGVALTTGQHTIELAVTDLDGLVGRASVTITVDAAPSSPVVSIVPVEPDSNDTLTVSVDEPSVDPEGGEVRYTWTWSRDGTAEPFFDDASIPSTQTAPGQLWDVVVWGVDPTGGRSLPASASTVVTNGPPSTTAPSIYPASATSDTTLYCIEGTTTDPEGDPTTVEFTWAVDGVYVGTGGALTPGTAIKGETVVCTATPSSLGSVGASVPSPGLLVDNAPPTAPVPIVAPLAPEADDTLVCSLAMSSTDPDLDTVTYSYTWWVNGAVAGLNTATVLATSTAEGDGWMCEVTPHDGTDSGPAGTYAVTIGAGVVQALDVGIEDSIYVGELTRGYWFEAPEAMTITGLRVPTSLAGDQNVEVVRFLSGNPPDYPASTGDFSSLHISLGVAGGDFIATSIGLMPGDVLGVLGGRGTSPLECSYETAGAFTSDIDGTSVVLTRLVYQDNLNTSGGADLLSSEPAGAIGRVEIEYSVP